MAGSVELRLTGGSTNNGPALSLGGVMSSVVVTATSINNLFDNVNQDEAQIGSTDYRAIDIINTSTDYNISSATLYLNPNVNSSSVKIYMGIESTGNPHVSTWNGVLTTAENVAPSGISFAEYPSSSPLSIPDIELDESLRLWFKRVVSPGAFKKCPTAFTLNLDGTYGLSFMDEQLPEITLEANVGTLQAGMATVDVWEQLPEATLEANVGTMVATIEEE
jgi:hypothetical protein